MGEIPIAVSGSRFGNVDTTGRWWGRGAVVRKEERKTTLKKRLHATRWGFTHCHPYSDIACDRFH